jgi:hypothetical protein
MIVADNILDTIKQRFNFTVDKLPLRGPDNLKTPWYGLFRSDTSEPVGGGSVTDRYTPHTSDDVTALVEAAAPSFGGASRVQCGFSNGHWLAIEPTDQHRLAVFGTQDNVFPRLVIQAPYGGAGSFRASVGYYRDVCRNLSIMRQVSGVSVKIRHTFSLRAKMDELIEDFSRLAGGWQQLTATIQRMEQTQDNMVEFLRAIYPEPTTDSGRAVTMHRSRTEAIFRRLVRERVAVGRPDIPATWMVTGWEAYNAVQGYVQHDSNRRGNPTPVERIMLAANDAAVTRAEALVLAM